jgi:transposase
LKGHLTMSSKERDRKAVLESVRCGGLTLSEAASALGLSRRQATRIYGRYCREGDAGLVHRSRGRRSNRRAPEELRERVLARYAERYAGFGPTLAAEKLAEEGLVVDHETLRRWLVQAGQWERRRKRKAYRQRRERRACRGELVQLDGSHHRWFGPDGAQHCVMQFIDDATGERLAVMDAQETTEAAMRGLRLWVERRGIPEALYVDCKSVFHTDRSPTVEEQLAGETPLTQFGKACRRLGIALIFARSAQAKGRVERAHAVLQDRFVKELALRGIADLEGADALLRDGFMEDLSRRFAVAPREKRDRHRKVPKGLDLDNVFCFEETRRLANDWTVRHKNRFYQVHEAQKGPLPKPKDRIAVCTRLDGTVFLAFGDKPLSFSECDEPPAKPPAPAPAARAPKRKTKPAPNHPWRGKAVRP